MKLTDSTVAVWGEVGSLNIDAADYLAEQFRECIEAAALDVLARLADRFPGILKLGLYVTVDGERIEPMPPEPFGCTRPSYAQAPTLDVESF